MEKIHLSMRQVLRSLREGRVDPVQLYEQSARRLRKLQHLNAVVTPLLETGQQQAAQAQHRHRQGQSVARILFPFPIFFLFASNSSYQTKKKRIKRN